MHGTHVHGYTCAVQLCGSTAATDRANRPQTHPHRQTFATLCTHPYTCQTHVRTTPPTCPPLHDSFPCRTRSRVSFTYTQTLEEHTPALPPSRTFMSSRLSSSGCSGQGEQVCAAGSRARPAKPSPAAPSHSAGSSDSSVEETWRLGGGRLVGTWRFCRMRFCVRRLFKRTVVEATPARCPNRGAPPVCFAADGAPHKHKHKHTRAGTHLGAGAAAAVHQLAHARPLIQAPAQQFSRVRGVCGAESQAYMAS